MAEGSGHRKGYELKTMRMGIGCRSRERREVYDMVWWKKQEEGSRAEGMHPCPKWNEGTHIVERGPEMMDISGLLGKGDVRSDEGAACYARPSTKGGDSDGCCVPGCLLSLDAE